MKAILCLFDKKSELYMQPFFVPAVGVGLRQVSDEMRSNKDSVLANHPKDFDVFVVGAFNESDAKIVAKVEFVCNCASLITEEG